MNADQLINKINALADESEAPDIVIEFINEGLSQIGVEVLATFPKLTLAGNEEPAIPEKWQSALLVPFGVARLKQKDSSQFEYQDSYSQFFSNLADFQAKYTVPIAYKDLVPDSEIIINGTTMYAEEGDTLYQLALDNSTTVDALVSENESFSFQEDHNASNIFETPPFHWGGTDW